MPSFRELSLLPTSAREQMHKTLSPLIQQESAHSLSTRGGYENPPNFVDHFLFDFFHLLFVLPFSRILHFLYPFSRFSPTFPNSINCSIFLAIFPFCPFSLFPHFCPLSPLFRHFPVPVFSYAPQSDTIFLFSRSPNFLFFSHFFTSSQFSLHFFHYRIFLMFQILHYFDGLACCPSFPLR